LTYAQVLTNFYITVNFQLRSSINAGLTDRYFYNRFCIETSAKVGFWGILGQGLRCLVGTPIGMRWPPIYVVWKTYASFQMLPLSMTFSDVYDYRSFQTRFYGSHDPTNSVIALKDDV